MASTSKRLISILLALTLVLGLAACTQATTQAPTTAAATPVATAVDKFAPEKGAVVRVASWDSDPKFFDMVIKEFNKKYPGITVSVELNTDYGKLLTQAASGTAADAWIASEDARMYAKEGLFQPLDAYIEASTEITKDMYIPDIFNNCIVDGKVMYIPKDYGIQGIYINKKLFAADNVAIPSADWTMDDFKKVATQLTKTGADGKQTQWGVYLNGTWDIPLDAICEQFGGNLLSPDGQTFDGYLNGPKTMEGLKWYFDMFTKEKITPNSEQQSAFTGIDAFEAGKCAMAWQGSWKYDAYKANPNIELAALPIPKNAATGSRANHITWAAYGMYSKTKVPNATWKFLEFQCGQPGQAILAAYAFPAIKSVAETVDIGGGPIATNPVLSVFYNAALKDATPYPSFKNPWWYSIYSQVGPAFDKLVDPKNADIDMKTVLDEATTNVTKEWANKKTDLESKGIKFTQTK
jgi:multiple sugar transport system substrate-binding protein